MKSIGCACQVSEEAGAFAGPLMVLSRINGLRVEVPSKKIDADPIFCKPEAGRVISSPLPPDVVVNEGTKGHLTVRTRTSEAAIIDGATILKGGTLELSGISNGDITVQRGGQLRVTGVVNGTVKNLGGSVEVEGMLHHLHTTGGKVIIGGNVGSVSGEGAVSYKKGAVIGGMPLDRPVRKGGKQ
ncbi:MAG: hypothetical protein ABI648_10760 [Betaproteobacteria bacterium]